MCKLPSAVKLRNIAKRVRRWAENNYKAYNVADDLCGMCGVAAYATGRILAKEKIPHEVCIAAMGGHCFVVCDGYLIDVTATQFNQAKIIVRKLSNDVIDDHWFWRVDRRWKEADQFRNYLLNRGSYSKTLLTVFNGGYLFK